MTEKPGLPPRRVLHVQKYYRPVFTGEGVFLERCSAVMHELDSTVEHELLVTHTPRPAVIAGFCSTLRRVAYLTTARRSAIVHELLLVWWFLRNLHRYQTVHFRTHADWYFLSYLLTKLMGRRLVLSATLDDSLPTLIRQYRPSLRALVARGFGLFDVYVGISPRLFEETRAVASDPARARLVPCGVTVPAGEPGERQHLRRSLGIADEAPVLLFVGGLCARKDPMFLIEEMGAVLAREPEARLVLVGPPLEPAYVASLRDAVALSGLGDAVIFAGEQLNPHPYFAAADILVMPSRLEGFGTVVPEAMAHRLPVVVRRLPGVNDHFVLHGDTGFLFDDRDGYLDGVLRLAGDARLRRRMGASGAALVAREFSMRVAASRYLDIYGMVPPIAPPPADVAETGLGCSASVVDRRFHFERAPHDMPDMPLLLTTIDAEESFDWSAPFSRASVDVSSMRCQHLAHRVFERHGVIPLYLADYPVATQDDGVAPLRDLLRDGLCDVGAHLHPWVTPPFTEAVNEYNSFAGNLPTGLELEKLRRLTGVLGDSFGAAPQIYRAGRFGAGLRTADVLKHLGYVADSSVSPCWPATAQRGDPWHWSGSRRPYWLDSERTILEIPTSAALVGRLAAASFERIPPIVYSDVAERLRLPGIAARLGMLERIRLTPEGMSLEDAKRLTRAMLAEGHRIFVLTYHSPTLQPGCTPYVRDADQRSRFLDWLDGYYSFFREEIGGRSATWREVRFGPVKQPVAAAGA